MALELNIKHTTLGRQIYDAGRRDVWISTLVEDYHTEIPALQNHLERLTAFQAKYVFDEVRRGTPLWDAYNDAERLQVAITPKP
ncbi:hypothetical protein IB277_13515 [Ensifer sp. ENS07]|uniref:hypothetical protein n=1 Tax=unclassified Ensifer TaxID=2633371 RepID=UPI00177AB884|nr:MULTISPECIES: hypothetical protein [unclassified Ensifer]MBD9508184.1 hypothetical protein [Ensifer sp. ENS10]MBD9637324.1 hypothetical protein [Ensifer sp. ENS07]